MMEVCNPKKVLLLDMLNYLCNQASLNYLHFLLYALTLLYQHQSYHNIYLKIHKFKKMTLRSLIFPKYVDLYKDKESS